MYPEKMLGYICYTPTQRIPFGITGSFKHQSMDADLSSILLTAVTRDLQILELLFWALKASEGFFQLVDVHLLFCFIYLPERT